MLRVLVAMIVLVSPLVPPAQGTHAGCVPPTVTPTQQAGDAYVLVREEHIVRVSVFYEQNGIPGLQTEGGCGHRADARLADVCGSVTTRIPGNELCLVETSS